MHAHDRRGLPVSGGFAAALDAVERFWDEFLGARSGSDAVCAAAEAHPECALLQLYAAALHLHAQSEAETRQAVPRLLARAARLQRGMTDRELLLQRAVEAWARCDFEVAKVHLETLCAEHPRDLVAAKFAEFLFYEAPDYPRHLHFMQELAEDNDGVPAFLAMLAFALSLAGRRDEAEEQAYRAIALERETPWAHHALAHVLLAEGRLEDGIRILGGLSASWPPPGQALHGHNWWHLALFHVEALDLETAWRIHGDHVVDRAPEAVVEHVDAISLLWRLELAGRDVGGEWRRLAPRFPERACEHVFPFLNAHYVYALGRAGETRIVRDAIRRAAEHAEAARGRGQHVWADVGVPLLRASLACAERDVAEAADLLTAIEADLACVGGSDAQVDLFHRALLDALVRSGRKSEARERLLARIGSRQATPLEERWLGAV